MVMKIEESMEEGSIVWKYGREKKKMCRSFLSLAYSRMSLKELIVRTSVW